jgi:hypothetical protein
MFKMKSNEFPVAMSPIGGNTLPSTQYTDYISTALDVLPRLQTKAINA